MKISIMRIDDRLIHGQIVTAWIAQADARMIIVADDIAARNNLQKTLLKMATPPGIKLHILGIQDAANLINNDKTDRCALLLVKGPAQANELIDKGIPITTINVGNISMKTGKIKFLAYLWLNDREIASLHELDQKGIKLEARAVPSERSQDVMELIKKERISYI